MEQGLDLDTIPSEGFRSWQVRHGSRDDHDCHQPDTDQLSHQIPPKYSPASTGEHLTSPATILITASFGHIIPTPFLTSHFSSPSSRLNVHPSLLPQYRGAAPIQWSIADSWRERHGVTGVTVQSLALGKGKVDCGDIWAQEGGIVSLFYRNRKAMKIGQTKADPFTGRLLTKNQRTRPCSRYWLGKEENFCYLRFVKFRTTP